MYKNVITLFLTIALLLWSVENAFAQSDSGSPYIPPGIGAKPGSFISNPGESAEPPREPPVTYVRKSVRDLAPLYLTEKNGELIPALNWTSEELDSLLQRVNENQRQADLPDYICESLTLTGVQKGETAEMLLKMQFTVPQKPVIRIPLQLNGVILLEAPKCTTGEFLAPQSGGGYVLFLKSEDKTHNSENQKPKEEQTPPAAGQTTEQAAENNESSDKDPAEKSENRATSHIVSESDSSSDASQKHEISLKILVPLQKNQSTYTLNMRLPKALFSQITLETPFSSVETRASSHAVVQPSESLDDGKKTRINAYSLGSEFQLQWQASESQDSNSRILESFTDIHVDIRPGVIFYTANMRLQYANQPPSEFILNLPPSAELLPSSTNEYSIERLSGAQPNVQNAVKIRLNNEYKSSSKLTFQARLPIEQTASVNWQDVMGFGIRGSVRQNGCIGVNVDKSYQVIWNPGQYVSRVDELPKTYEGEYQYAFLFSEQPCSLMARIVAGRTRINVQPQYNVFIGEEEMRLDVSWTYNIRGGQVNWLDVDLNGWQLRSVKDIGPENTFTSESREDGGRVSARLAQPTTGTVNMKTQYTFTYSYQSAGYVHMGSYSFNDTTNVLTLIGNDYGASMNYNGYTYYVDYIVNEVIASGGDDGSYVAGRGIQISSVSETNKIKLVIEKIRNSAGSPYLQMRSIEFIDDNLNPVTITSGTAIWSDGTAVTYASANETLTNMLAGTYKMCVESFTEGKSLEITLNLSTDVSYDRIKFFRYKTGDDYSERDPVSWTISANNADATSSWQVINQEADEDITTSRNTWTNYYECSFEEQVNSINIKCGDGLTINSQNELTIDSSSITLILNCVPDPEEP